MYKTFFGLNRSPFELSPDPYFIYPTERIKETLSSVYYAISQRKGFVVLTGEVGTGKTLMMRWLLDLLKRQQVPFSNVFNPRLSSIDLFRYICHDLGINVDEPTKGNLLQALYRFLLVQLEKGLTTVLVVDEAQQLSSNVLEEVRLLTNLETTQQKLVQIILVGQPELDTKLDSFELRQLKQRIAVRCRLEPFREDEVRTYIERRLRLAGATAQAHTIFPVETVEAIYRYSLGVPRVINSICEQALVAAYARGTSSISVEIIDEIATYFRLQPAACSFEREKARAFGVGDQESAAKSLLKRIEHMERIAAQLSRQAARAPSSLAIEEHL